MSQPPYDQQLAAWHQQLAAMGYSYPNSYSYPYGQPPVNAFYLHQQQQATGMPGRYPAIPSTAQIPLIRPQDFKKRIASGSSLPVTATSTAITSLQAIESPSRIGGSDISPIMSNIKSEQLPLTTKQLSQNQSSSVRDSTRSPESKWQTTTYDNSRLSSQNPLQYQPAQLQSQLELLGDDQETSEHSDALKEFVKSVFLLTAQRTMPADTVRWKLANFVQNRPKNFDWATASPDRFLDTVQNELEVLTKAKKKKLKRSNPLPRMGDYSRSTTPVHDAHPNPEKKLSRNYGPVLPLAEPILTNQNGPSTSSSHDAPWHHQKQSPLAKSKRHLNMQNNIDDIKGTYSPITGDSSGADDETDAKAARRHARFQADRDAHSAKLDGNRINDSSLADYAEIHRQQIGDDNWDIHAVVGTNTEHEKLFLRLIGKPNPALVRPLPVLEQAFHHTIMPKYKKDRNYPYMCDQMKSMRQDLLVQRLQTDFTALVYETHAHVALEHGDLGEYNACQTQLKILYAKGLKGHQTEFLAYRILYLVYIKARGELKKLRYELRGFERQDPLVRFALSVWSAVNVGSYLKFFELFQQSQTTALTRYLMAFMLPKERARALQVIFSSHIKVTMDWLTIMLSFRTQFDCVKFLNMLISEVVVQDTDSFLIDEVNIPNDIHCRALKSVPEAWLTMPKNRRVDIKGQIH